MSQLTVSEAHRTTKKARTTIERHIADGTLSVAKNDSGSYLIDVSELQRVYGKVDPESIKKAQQKPASLQLAATENVLEIQQLRHQLELSERDREEAQRREREERDRHQETREEKGRLFDLLEQAQKTIATLPAANPEPIPPAEPPKRRLWARLTGKAG